MSCSFLVSGRPALTVMIRARTAKRVQELVERGLADGADAFGLQIDSMLPAERTPETLRHIFAAADGKPFYCTNYRSDQNDGKNEDTLAAELVEAAECGGALIDIMGDLFAPTPGELTLDAAAVEKQKKLADTIHQRGAEVLMSCHVGRTLTKNAVLELARIQLSRGIDLPKIVTNADTPEQENEAFATTLLLNRELDSPFLFLCGGEHSRRHRRLAPALTESLFLCVAERDELAVPAQPLLSEAKAALTAAGFSL